MKQFLTLIALAGSLSLCMAQTAAPAAAAPAAAPAAKAPAMAEADKPMTGQQNRMKTCNADAATKALKGDPRKAFMKSCLSGDTAAAPAATAQQNKMKTCNADPKAKTLKGDERKAFMSSCLKG